MPNRLNPSRLADPSVDRALQDLSKSVDSSIPLPEFGVVTDANVTVREGQFKHLAPRSTGQNVVIPAPSADNFGRRITLFVDGALGACRVRAVSGLINGVAAFTLAAGNVTYIELISNGKNGWATARAAGFPTAGNGLAYTGDTLNVVLGNALSFVTGAVALTGSTSTINVNPTSGALGVVDISTLQCGGVLTFQALSEANISGFTAKTDGFFFFVHVRDSTTSAALTLLENAGANTSIVTPNTRDWRLTSDDTALLVYNNTRWRVVAAREKFFMESQQAVTWAAQQNDFTRTSRATQHLRVTLTGDQTLTGIVPDTSANGTPNGEVLALTNVDTTDTLRIAHQLTSTAANQFFLPGAADIYLGPGCSILFRYDGTSSRWRPFGMQNNDSGRLLRRTILTTGTGATHNLLFATRFFIVKGVGGGGAAGGLNNAAGAAGAGGGSGTYGERLYTTVAGTVACTYTVGQGGAGISGGTGNNGTSSTFLYNGTTITLPAGQGAPGLAGGAGVGYSAPGGLGGAAATNADWSSLGERGGPAYRPQAATTPCFGGKGGGTPIGAPGKFGHTITTVDTGSAGGPGSGASGSANGTTATAAVGISGANGLWIVEEYS